MIPLLIGAFSSVFAGGATGLLGVLMQRFFDGQDRKTDLAKLKLQGEQEVQLRKLDIEMTHAEWNARARVAELETAGKIGVADSNAFAASYNLEPKLYSEGQKKSKMSAALFVVLDVIRGLIRPVLTIYLCAVVTMIYLNLFKLAGGSLIDDFTAAEMLPKIIDHILYLFTTCVCWWFGTRNNAKTPGK